MTGWHTRLSAVDFIGISQAFNYKLVTLDYIRGELPGEGGTELPSPGRESGKPMPYEWFVISIFRITTF